MGQPVMQWQILAKNPEHSAEFYTALFGWTVNASNALGYRAVDTGARRGINGGIWPCSPEGKSMVQLFVEVDNVAAHVESCKRLGGSVVMGPQLLPDGDEMAIIVDPEGLPVGLFRPAAKSGLAGGV